MSETLMEITRVEGGTVKESWELGPGGSFVVPADWDKVDIWAKEMFRLEKLDNGNMRLKLVEGE